jgi:O-antigen ligase
MSVLGTGVVILAPLPFGSTHPWSVSSIEVAAFLLLGVLLALRGIDGLRSSLGTLGPPLVALFVYLCLQRTPLPNAALALVSPQTVRLYATLLGDTARWLPLSLDPQSSGLALVRLLAYATLFLVVAAAPGPRRGVAIFWIWTLLAATTLSAAVAWLHLAFGWHAKLFDRFAALDGGGIPGLLSWPFVNMNHLATAMNLGWPIALGALLSPSAMGAVASRAGRFAVRIVAAPLFVLLAATLAGTHSRGGLIAATAAPLVMSLAWPIEARVTARMRAGVGAAVFFALVVGAAWIAVDVVAHPAERVDLAALSRADATMQIRLVAIRQSLGILRDFPVFGAGLGTWAEIFPTYQRYPLLAVSFLYAHNEYVQWFEETGLIGFALLAALCAEYFAAVLRPLPADVARRRAILLAAAATAAVHSAVDFGLRVPANALLLTVVLGVLWRERQPQGATQPAARTGTFSDRLLACVAGIVVIALLVYLGTLEWRANSPNGWQAFENAAWQRPQEGLPNFDLAAAAVAAAPAAAPAHHTLAFASRSIHVRELELRRALRCAPAFAYVRLDLARLLVALGRREEAAKEVERAAYEDPYSGPGDLMTLRDPRTGVYEFREAVLRGLKRRGLESPAVAEMARGLESAARR